MPPSSQARTSCARNPSALPTRGRDQRQEAELDHGDLQDQRLRRTQAFHHGDIVEVALRIASRGHRDRDRSEQHRDQRREIEESSRALGGRADLRTRLLDIHQPLARLAPFRKQRS